MDLFRLPKGDGVLATDYYYASEFYNLGNGDGRKGSICGKEVGSIHVCQKGFLPIENFWPAARFLTLKGEGFVTPLSSADITRLGSTDHKRIFYVQGVYMPGTGTVINSHSSFLNFLFAYQTLRDNTVHWTLSNTIDAQAAIKNAILRSNIGHGIGNAVVTVVTLPLSLFFAKALFKQDYTKAETLPSMEVLKQFVQQHAKR